MATDLKNKVEAVLFASGKSVDIEEITRLCRSREPEEIKKALAELKNDYDKHQGSVVLIEEGNKWKLTVREAYMPVAKRIIADTEVPKSTIETLAVIAWKNPIKQSEIIRIRGNKSYDHLNEIEELGFIVRQKQGRTKLIKLTEKFFKYFEMSGNKDIKEVFKHIKEQPAQKQVPEFGEDGEKLGGLAVYDEPKEAQKQEEKVQEKNKVAEEEKTVQAETEPAQNTPEPQAVNAAKEKKEAKAKQKRQEKAEAKEEKKEEDELEPKMLEDNPEEEAKEDANNKEEDNY